MVILDGIWGHQSNYKYQAVMQFTGLCDKEGKEIYEGDILQYAGGSISIGRVEWIKECAQFLVRLTHKINIKTQKTERRADSYDTPLLEDKIGGYYVLGNIYENPDLLGLANPT